MRKKIELDRSKLLEEALELYSCDPAVSLHNLHAAGQMIVDSDACAFIYLAEASGEDDYTYLYLPVAVWEDIHTAIQTRKKVFAVSGEERLELLQFHEELDYLLDNMQDNSNYGKNMLEKVASVFTMERGTKG
ncbi:hypothetical protein [Heyndrickxia acidiproducens]|uniref:UPF0738 family protein n=1 Tax=Heyndrickxia acidiproducens TaxID=1121084 RepID=UPI00036F3A75|nr:hypothetical protein [Heyndrickxia acidiproducens]